MVNLIRNYINKINIDDLNNFLNNKGIYLKNDELSIIYDYVKNKWYEFLYNDASPILKDLKNKISDSNYNKLYKLYIWAKEKYSNYL